MGDAILMIEILVLGVLVIGFLALIIIRGDQRLVKPLAEPLPTLPPVLLPDAEELSAHDIQDIRFAVGLRGYRTDQVDQVLDRLETTLAERDEQIVALRKAVEDANRQANESAPK